ncbi:MAG: hypothetical protein AMXMBFR61_18310 [Fimbriimonadales bacterium]
MTMPRDIIRALIVPLALTAVCCVSVAQGSPSQFNMLEGIGSFEDDWDGDGFANWWGTIVDPVTKQPVYNKSVFTVGLSSESPAHGIRSQRVAISKNDGSSYGLTFWAQTKVSDGALRPGSRVLLRFKYRTSETVQNVQWKVWYRCVLPSDPNVGYGEFQRSTVLTPELTWREWQGEVYVPEDRTELHVGFHIMATAGNSSGTIWLDDVRLTDGRVYEPPFEKPIKLFYMYRQYKNWVETARRADAAGQHEYHNAPGIKALRPEFLNIHWMRVAYTADEDHYSLENLFPFSWVQANHPEWFLRDAEGNLMQGDNATSLDLGNTDYQDHLLARILELAPREKWDALLVEFLHQDRRLNTLNQRDPAGYATDAEWQAAVTGLLQKLQPLRQMGIKLIPNMGCTGILEEPGATWIQLCDGFIFEWGFAMQEKDGSVFYSDWNSWRYKFLSLVNAGSKIIIVGHRLPDSWVAIRRYALASYLCGMSDNTYFGFATPETEAAWFDEFAAPLGRPTETYKVVAGNMSTGALIKRAFENGLVVVNPAETQTFLWTCPGVYQDLDGNVVEPGTKSLAPRTGLILLNAPKLVMSMTASPATPAPGEIVTYRVEFRNVGTASALNAYVSASVPPYTSFSSAQNGGVYDIVQNRVVWNVGTVNPGASGTLTFKVRVQ